MFLLFPGPELTATYSTNKYCRAVLIAIFRNAVKPSCFFIMARLAQALPVAPLPEQFIVAAVRNDVVHHGGLCVLAMLQTLHAHRVFPKICLADLLPLSAVAALGGGACGFRVKGFMFLAVCLR